MISAKRKAFIFLTIAFLLAIMTGWFINSQVSQAKELMGQSVKVAVAKKDVSAYTEITPDMIDWLSIPKSSAVSSFLTSEKEMEDHLFIVNMKKGDLITKNLIRSRVDIPEGYRVVWLNPTENVIMDQEIFVGDKVDIIASYKSDNEGKIETKRIMNNINVIQSESVRLEDKGNTSMAIKVSLTIEQAEQLIHMQNTADQIRVLRINQLEMNDSQVDSEVEQTPVQEEPVNQEVKENTEVKENPPAQSPAKESDKKEEPKKEEVKKEEPKKDEKKENDGDKK
ncbi:Flp pilus assembly protein CpaB [Lederbergia wuyishanensis]|uniref:Pilus assembly protein CpaB n=1 Tax=Lederbergia wuyishanensis TaxID=1347903 RepID=A0ABU0D6P6_9BACI|nr:Flp pilus assembly protein CpaB [Lederbergia wuyishanensis]MCJ8008773.1 Flp pilus assembly protein CpaB [Lederbergia wuyishanensis]MDQ0344093.1 pilus assembly protein CpaB [Lederbergia wuyishanensis]